MEKEINKYLTSVRRRLNLPNQIRQRCISDLQTTIQARLENGESWQDIQQTLGTPKAVAAELSEQLKEFVYRKSPWRFIFLAAAVLSGVWLAFYAGMQLVLQFLASEAASIGIIGGADGPTAIFIATGTIMDWDAVIICGILIVGIVGFLRLRKCKPQS